MDISKTIEAKSDQLNAIDLVAPLVATICKVVVVEGEQPVHVFLDGMPAKPWKPSKGMRRVLIKLWGAESNNWVGKKVRLFCDDSVKYAGLEIGGIRISGASGIDKCIDVPVRINRSQFVVLKIEPLTDDVVSVEDLKAMIAEARGDKAGETTENVLKKFSVDSLDKLTQQQIKFVIDNLKKGKK